MLMESQFWPPEQMLAHQRGQLAQLRWHVKENIPIYNTRLDPVSEKDCEIDWNRPHELPNLARADIKEQGAAMMAKTLPRSRSL